MYGENNMISLQKNRNSSRRKPVVVSATKGDGVYMILVPLSLAVCVGAVAGHITPTLELVSWHSLEKRPGG